MRARLPLSEVRSGSFGRDFEDLRWYFSEALHAQSGLKSSQYALERALLVGVLPPVVPHQFDGRRLEAIRRARKIEVKLKRLPPHHWLTLYRYFGDILPLIEAFPPTKQGQRAATRLRADFEESFTVAMRAYCGSHP